MNTSLWLKIRAMFSDKFQPFVPHNWISRKLIHSYARSVARIRTTLFIALRAPVTQYSFLFVLSHSTPYYNLVSCPQHYVIRPRDQTFWPRDSNTIFEIKIAQLSGIIKSPIFFKRGSIFEIGSLKRWTFKILKH